MADGSTRKRIRTALADRLKAITILNGFNTDAGEYVEHGKHKASEDDTLPRLVLVAGEIESIDKTMGGTETRRWLLAAVGLATDDPENPLAVEDLIEDIKRAIFQPTDRTLGGLVIQLESLGAETVTDPEDGGKVMACSVPFSVRYLEGYGAP